MKKKRQNPEFDINQLKKNVALSALKKLELLEQLNQFIFKAMPQKSKKTWEKLKAKGY